MVLVRCEKHGRPRHRTMPYIRAVNPVGYPDTAAICGIVGCDQPGKVWLHKDEADFYNRRQRIFSLPTHAAKIRVI